ncbi:MAG: hypothetical protein H6658_19545 [Ardenticatenaceae bacterium]|nr:hypothetical protein [Ardenticatenaceae bacterium]
MSRKQKQKEVEARVGKFIGTAVLVIFVGSILWSMWAETLYPLIRAGDWRSVVLHLVGLPLILVGVGMFVYGGYVFVRGTLGAYADEQMVQSMLTIRSKSPRKEVTAARWQTLRIFWQMWKRGLAWLGLGFLVLAVGSVVINL